MSVPGRIIAITIETQAGAQRGKVKFGGIVKEVDLSALPDVTVGDYVEVETGIAVAKLDRTDTEEFMETIHHFKGETSG